MAEKTGVLVLVIPLSSRVTQAQDLYWKMSPNPLQLGKGAGMSM